MIGEDLSLIVKRSTLPFAGKGLFTKKRISKNTRILEYTGKITSWKNVNHQGGSNPFIFYINNNRVIDASSDTTVLARYANDAKGLIRIKGIRNNCKYVLESRRVYIESTKIIPAGAEILVAYGKEYWDVIKKNKALDALENNTTSKKKTTKKKD